jgi:hypothetical protein
MLFYTKFFIKYLTLASAIWITYSLILGFYSKTSDVNEMNQKMIEKIIEKAKEKQKIIENVIKDELVELGLQKKESDHDHPKEELDKSEKQKKHRSRQIQVNAPVVHDSKSPGILVLRISYN